jgi:nitroimidazol reductase NimA-like FMN-containing flavoprotein (pyridoxamine 5'-phosphate oxidase superfamily)
MTDSSTPTKPATGAERPKRPGVRLSPDEAWAFIEGSHTGIVTTLRRDGFPIALPVWFATLDRHVYLSTPGGSKKVARIRHDSRTSFLVESGEMWAELKAVHLTGRAEIIEHDEVIATRFREAIEVKYAAFRTASSAMPDATRKHYGQPPALIRFTPDDRIVSWDNARLFG